MNYSIENISYIYISNIRRNISSQEKFLDEKKKDRKMGSIKNDQS